MTRTYQDPHGFDQATAERWYGYIRAILWPYFRPQVIGAENLPPSGRGLIVGCHSGVIPYDAACVLVAINEATGRYARAIGDDMFGWVKAVEDFLRKQGAVVGRRDLTEKLLREDNLVVLFPGGAKDMTRSYLTQRYHVVPHSGLAPGRGGYIKIALRTETPIIPVAVVGAEEAHLLLANLNGVARAVRFPIVPLVLFPFPVPAKIYIRFGKPFRLPGAPEDAGDQRVVDRLNRLVRQRLQRLIDDTVRRRHGIILSAYDEGGARRNGARRCR